ncbi:MAG: Gldg family protein [Planctomycetes bacterium]|nr:Gldg family protein [Planctomycetota bacterium]
MIGRRWVAFGNLLVAALLMLAVWVLLVWVAARPALKTLIDLTPQRVNSVDEATEDLLRELRAAGTAVEFHLFFPPIEGRPQTDAQRQGMAIRTRLRDLTRILLRRYQWLGGEAVTIHEHDLYTDVERSREAAQRFDYKSAELDVLVVAVEAAGRARRFHKLSLIEDLATIDLPGTPNASPVPRAAVPVLKDFKGEAQISSALKGLLVQGVPVACFLRGYSPDLDLDGATGSAYGSFRGALQQAGFEVRDFDLRSGGVPADAALVVVLEPRSDFSDGDAVRLFDYVRGGGRLFLSYSWAGLPDWNPTGGRLGELLGYELSQAPVFHLIPDASGRAGGRGIDGPGVEKLQVEGSPLHPVTRRFVSVGRPLEVGAARAVRQREGAPEGMRREALLWTGPAAWLAGVDARDGRPDQRAPRVGLQSYTVGMSIELDPDGDGVAPQDGGDPLRAGRVVVTSGVFCNNAYMRQFGDLALNVCNWMAERRVLLDIRGSRYEARHLQLSPQQLARVHAFLVYGVPGAFLVLGGLVLFLRRRV